MDVGVSPTPTCRALASPASTRRSLSRSNSLSWTLLAPRACGAPRALRVDQVLGSRCRALAGLDVLEAPGLPGRRGCIRACFADCAPQTSPTGGARACSFVARVIVRLKTLRAVCVGHTRDRAVTHPTIALTNDGHRAPSCRCLAFRWTVRAGGAAALHLVAACFTPPEVHRCFHSER